MINYKRGYALGIAARVGSTVSSAKNLLAYIKLGVEASHDKARLGEIKEKGKVVFTPGIGIEKAFGNILGRIEYVYNCGAKLNNVSYTENRIKLGTAYKF